MKFSNAINFVSLVTGLVHQLFNPRARVEEDVAATRVQSHFAHRRAPRPEPRKRKDHFVARHLPHLLQHGQRIADVIEEPDTEADVKLLVAFVFEEVRLLKLADVVEILFPARFLAQTNHHFRDVDSQNSARTLARELETIKTVAAADVEKRPVFDRLTMLYREHITLVHIFAKDVVEHV